jgi:uncharacterized protein YndB with AHSA1/START domain
VPRNILRKALIALAVVGAFIGVIVLTGYALPVGHVASRTATLSQPVDRVYAALTDIASYPQWRSDVKSVEVLSAAPPRRWREHGGNGDITFEVAEAQPPMRLVTRIADRDLPFGGTWTYELMAEGNGTRLTITEHGEVYNPIFRIMSRFVFGHTATMDQFLADLKKHLG